MKRKKFRLTIENKLLLSVLFICMLSVLCLGCLLIYSSYSSKLAREYENGNLLVSYLKSDIDILAPANEKETILEVCKKLSDPNLYIFDENGELLLGRRSLAEINPDDIVSQNTENALSWHILYAVDRTELQNVLIEEQKYIIIATIALLVITVQVGIFVAYNISEPIRKLSNTCAEISAHPEHPAGSVATLATRGDEIGQLADAFSKMLQNLEGYNAELSRQKSLNGSIIENLPIGIAAFDKSGKVLCVNTKALTLLENTDYTTAGRTLREILAHILSQEQLLHDPIHMTGPEGKARDYQIGVWQLSGDGGDWGVVCTIDDITYNKMMEEKVSENEKLAYTGKIAAMLAHEIRNPLAGIRASIQVVSRRLSADRDQLLCSSMVHEVDRVNLLIEDLLNLARQRKRNKALIGIGPLYEEIFMLYSKIAENKGVTFDISVTGEPVAFCDESELKQVLVNLINNAIKAMPSGGFLRLTAHDTPGGARLTVEDSGIGMTADKLRSVQKSASDGGSKGSYGLAIVTKLLSENGGSFYMESTPQSGTVVTLRFAPVVEYPPKEI